MNKIISKILIIVMVMNIIFTTGPIKIEAKEITSNQSTNSQNENNLKLVVGEKEVLDYVSEEVKYEEKELKWISENESIVTVTNKEVTALQPGRTKIKLMGEDDKVIRYYDIEVIKSSISSYTSHSIEEEIHKFILSASKNYQIINNSYEELEIENTSGNGSNFNIVQYDVDGNVDAIFKDEKGTLILGPKMKLKVSVVGDIDVECSILKSQSKSIVVQETEIPALDEYTIYPNQNIKIENLSKENIKIKNQSWAYGPYEYVQYNVDNTIKSFELDTYKNIHLESEEVIKIHAYNNKVNLCFPWEYKEKIEITEEVEEPIHRFMLDSGKSYEIRNLLDKDIEMKNNSGYYTRYDIVTYDENTNIKRFDIDTYGSINLKKGEKTKIYLYNNIEFFQPQEYKNNYDITEINEEPLYKFNLDANKNYEIKNVSEDNIKIINDSGYYRRYDMVSYKEDNSIKDFNKYIYGEISVSKGEYLNIRTDENGLNCWIPKEYKDDFTVKEVDYEPLHKFNLEKNRNYKIYNILDEKMTIKIDRVYYVRYDLIHYKADGSYTTYIDKWGNIELDKGDYIIISNSESNEGSIECFIPNDLYEFGVIISELDQEISDIVELLPKIKFNITKVMSKGEDESENNKVKDTLSKYKIDVYNKTQNKKINNSQIKNDYLILPNGSTNSKDELTIKIESKDNSTVKLELNITMDQTNNAILDVEVQELGYLKINHKYSDESSLIKMLVFDSKGNIIEDISNNNKPIITKYFTEGEYTVVLLKAKSDLWRVNTLNDFDKKGFKENEDYIKYKFNIKDGVIDEFDAGEIPKVDEDRLSFFNRNNTHFIIDTSEVIQGGNIEVRLEYSFKEQYNKDNIKNKSIYIYIDEGTTIKKDSLILDNKKANYYKKNGYIEVPIENLSGIIRFYVSVDDAKQSLTAKAYFDFDGIGMNESIGRVDIEADYITINGPSEISSKNTIVYGITKPESKVSVYCGKQKLGETTSSKSGKWKTNIDLPSTYSSHNYDIHAKLDENSLNEKVSNEINIKYKQSSIDLENIVMYYRLHSETKKLDLTKAFLEGDIPKYTYLPGHKFTFKVKMKNSQDIEKLYITSERNNEVKRLEAMYDKDADTWIASGFFDPNDTSYVPGILNIVYIPTIESIMKPELLDEWKNATVKANETDEKIEYFIILDDKEKTPVKVTIKDKIITRSSAQEYGKLSEDEKEFVIDIGTGEEIKELVLEIIGNKTINDMFDINDKYNSILDLSQLIDRSLDWNELNDIQRKDLSSDILQNIVSILYGEGTNAVMDWAFEKVIDLTKQATNNLIDLLDEAWKDIEEGWSELKDYWRERKVSKEGAKTKAAIDPSGYVYEAVHDNRVEGVTATVYYRGENGESIEWDAKEYDQINPLITDKEGRYEWFVPEGLWQVKYEKEGYETTYSDWLPVPPPQTEVNIGIVSYEKPKIELFNMYEDRAEITFNKYIDTLTINTDSIKLSDSKGNSIPITIEVANEEESKDDKMLAKKFILKTHTKNTLSLDNEYTLTIKNTVKTYAGISPNNDIVEKTIYKQLPTEIKVEDSYEVQYNKEISIPVSIDNISNADEFEVTAISSMSDIAKVATEKVEFDKDGKAVIKVLGQLPGQATITFNIDGTDLESQTKINVLLPKEDNTENTPPVIYAKDIELKVGDEFKVLDGVTAYDEEDGEITSRIVVIENTVNTSTAGIYKVVYEVTDSNGSTVTKEIKVTVNPKLTLINRIPKIEAKDTKIKVDSIFDPMSIAKAIDYEDGDITNNIEIIENTVDTSKVGVYKVVYKVTDSKGATTTKTITITVENKDDEDSTGGGVIIPTPPTGGGSVTPIPPQEQIEFNDIKGHWAEETIKEFTDKNFINGYEDNTFKPNNNMTRAEFVKVVNKVFGYTQKGEEQFTDVNKDDWFYEEICIGIKEGYIKGKSKEVFAPNDNITREEVAMILTNIMKNKDENLDKLNTFKDGNKTSQWAQSSVEGAIEAGYLNGDDKGLLNPTNNITRAEAISMLSRVKK